MEKAITEIVDREAIRTVLGNYCRGNDRHDVAMVEECFWEDAEAEYGLWRGRARDLPQFASDTLKKNYINTSHMIAQCDIRLNGDAAVSETYCQAAHFLSEEGGADVATDIFWCRYVDKFEKRGGVWRISFRMMITDQIQRVTGGGRGPNDMTLCLLGRQGGDDPSYRVLDC